MTKPIGRLYWNGNSVSGYIVIGNYALKFASQTRTSGTSWIYQSKSQIEQEQNAIAKVEEETREKTIFEKMEDAITA